LIDASARFARYGFRSAMIESRMRMTWARLMSSSGIAKSGSNRLRQPGVAF
jgi:hypothetical protein